MSQAPLVAGIELGGTKCVAILARGPDEILERVRVPTTRPEETLPALEAAIDGWRDFAALGIASFGPISIDRRSPDFGSITITTKPHWSHTDIAKRLGARYGVPVGFHTDVAGAALGEARWGAARGLGDLAYVTVGTGIGVGLVAGGRPVDGMTHGELGHVRPVRLAGDDWPGSCPFHGACAEGLASGTAIGARTGVEGQSLSPDHPVWESVTHALAQLLHTLVMTGVPRRIVMGGGVMVGNPFLLPVIRAGLRRSLGGYVALPEVEEIETFVVGAGLGADAGPLGAIVLGELALEQADC
ncbi:ROK family protein [Sphingomonas sp. TX0543]|uniref:ROK family protein n=1 Tax=unclassified Sphingomonas TaxID=196159 RepID=UPI0010F60B71|nr:ROK family protein [Sphingomonas sp. 3P27F8]